MRRAASQRRAIYYGNYYADFYSDYYGDLYTGNPSPRP